jgi:DNA-binding NtrC family response regulator
LVARYKFKDGSEAVTPLTDLIYGLLLKDAIVMNASPAEFHPKTRAAAEKRLRYAAEAAAEKELRNARTIKTVSDNQILAAVAAHKNQTDAAAALGITDRQLRTRLTRIDSNRKS